MYIGQTLYVKKIIALPNIFLSGYRPQIPFDMKTANILAPQRNDVIYVMLHTSLESETNRLLIDGFNLVWI